MSAIHGAALTERVRQRVIADNTPLDSVGLRAALRAEGVVAGSAGVLGILSELHAEFVGLGPLEDLLSDTNVTDILVNSSDGIYVDRGGGLELSARTLPDESAARRLAERLAAAAGRRLDEAAPWVDARIGRGVRLHAIIPPVSPAGTMISLRIPRAQAFTIDQLVEGGSLTPLMARTLQGVVHKRLAYLVTGGTGTGKTTLLASLLGLVPATQRIVVVEDTGELLPHHCHAVRLEARPANVEGAGAVTLRDLVRQALRMRPDRLVVGEVRGAEVVDLLAALNTGHEGGCGTIHANSCADVPARVQALAAMAGVGREAISTQFLAAVQLVIGLHRDRGGQRRVSEIAVVVEREATVVTVPAVTWQGEGAGFGRLQKLLADKGVFGE